MPTYKTEDIFGSDMDVLGATLGVPESISGPRAGEYFLKAVDVAAGGPLVRAVMETPPTVPEFAGTGEEIPTRSTRDLFGDIGEQIGKAGLGGPMPESPTTEYQITPQFGRQALPLAAELAAYPAAGRLVAEGAGILARGVKTTAEAFPELAQAGAKTLASQAGAVGQPNTLVSWVRSKGGLWDPSLPGEVSQFVKEQGVVGLVSKRTGRPLDELASQAVSDGWLPEGSQSSDLVEALKADLSRVGTQRRVGAPGADIDQQVAAQMEQEREAAAAAAPEMPKPRVEELPKYAGSINVERMALDADELRYLNKVYGQNQSLIDKMRRGTITLDETRAQAEKMLADDLGLSEIKWQKGQALNAEQITARRMDLATKTAQVGDIARQVAAGNNSTDKLGELIQAINSQLKAQAETSAVATEAGRALSALRIPAEPGALRASYIKKMVDAMGGRELTEDIAGKLAVAAESGPLAVSRFIRDMARPKFKDVLYEVWVNGLLSGPVTHEANTLGNTLAFLTKVPERAAGTLIEAGRALVTGTPRERLIGELPAQAVGLWQGLKQGVRRGLFALAHGVAPGDVSKLEYVSARAGAIPGKVGEVVRAPSKALVAADEFFKAVNAETEFYGLAYRLAQKTGGPGTIAERTAKILADPPQALLDAAREEALYRTFQKELGPSGRALVTVRNKIPGLRYIVPFMRTPINIAKFALERTPLGIARTVSRVVRGELKGAEISDELAKGAVGSLIGTAAYMYAKEGNITGGGPEDRGRRQALLRTGWQPYSIKIGDTYYSYNRLEPVGSIIGLAADYSEIEEYMADEGEKARVATLIGQSVAQNLTSKTFLVGVSNLINAIDDPQRYGEQYAKNMMGTLVPAAAAQLARAFDPNLRRTDDIFAGETMRARVPGASTGLLPKLDLWGNPIERPAKGLAALLPVVASGEKRDPVDREIVRLKLNLTMPAKTIQGVTLTPEQHNDYTHLAGQWSKEKLDGLVNQTSWKDRSDYEKERVIRGVIEQGRERARDFLIKLYPDLAEQVKAARQKGR
jgi:hypothetical protein